MDINIIYFTLLIWKARKATQISHISKNKTYFIYYQQNETALAILDEKFPVFESTLSNFFYRCSVNSEIYIVHSRKKCTIY